MPKGKEKLITSKPSESDHFKEKKQVYTSKDAMVEVIIKIKKRRNKSSHREKEEEIKEIPLPEKEFPKGSWGDLLSQNRLYEVNKAVKEIKKHPRELKLTDGHSPMKKHQKELKCTYRHSPIKKHTKELEYTDGHSPMKKHTKELECTDGHSPMKKHPKEFECTDGHSHMKKHPKELECTDGHSPMKKHPKELECPDVHSSMKTNQLKVQPKSMKDEELELQNLALKREANRLLQEMQKAQKEHKESIATMRELYQTAESLKKENQELHGAQEQQQFLQEKLIQAISENQELKTYLESAMNTMKDSADKDDQLAKIRDVIEEVKSTIENEIKGINHSQSLQFGEPEMIRGFDFNVSEKESTLLNDTNASEIQRILSAIESNDEIESNVSPLKGVSDYLMSPQVRNQQISTPNYQPTTQDSANGGYFIVKNKGKGFESLTSSDGSRTFKPIQEEL